MLVLYTKRNVNKHFKIDIMNFKQSSKPYLAILVSLFLGILASVFFVDQKATQPITIEIENTEAIFSENNSQKVLQVIP